MYRRFCDVLLTLLGLLLVLPLSLIIVLLVWSGLGRPLLFVQLRPGLNGKPFKFYKFRTMLNTVDAEGNDLADEDRLTKLGVFLRSTSLDELPSFWNVLKGDMSLVGPRPLLMEYLPLYSPEQARRHSVRPGITGWVQVNGRNSLSWEDKFKLDVWYVDNHSFLLDLKIIFLTIKKVFVREGIHADGHVTMSAFKGNSKK